MAYIIEGVEFEWDTEKEKQNVKKHGVTFTEASRLFTGHSTYLELYDDNHSGDEDRFIAIGPVVRGLIVVVYVERNVDIIRIISARKAKRLEIKLFDEFKRGKR